MSDNRLTAGKTVLGIILSIAVLVIAQLVSLLLSDLLVGVGVPGFICNILAGVLYAFVAYIGVRFLCLKVLGVSPESLNITGFSVKWYWIVAAILLPVLVLLFSFLTGGYWEVNSFDTDTVLNTVTSAAFFYGLATGIVEEMVFRGVIMGCLNKRFGSFVSVVAPSVLFGAVHIIGSSLSFLSTVQLLIAGTAVGILFSLIELESSSFWNNAIVHAVWNMTIIGSILYIGQSADSSSILNYVLGSDSFLITGGDFGIESSVISIAVYVLFSVVAVLLIRRRAGRN